jgi:hypothetical protein
MEFARWTVQANEPVGDGTVARDHWEAAARRGSAAALARLEGPPIPESVEYLWGWLMELHGRSGAHMSGINPLSYSTVAEWARLTRTDVDTLEVRALMQLDAALLARTEDVEEEAPPADVTPAWPEKKTDG